LNPERVLKKMREGRAALLPRHSKGAQLSYHNLMSAALLGWGCVATFNTQADLMASALRHHLSDVPYC